MPGGAGLTGPAKRLLARLVLSGGKTYGRSEIAESLWPDAEAERGRFYLRRALTQLRGAVDEAWRLEADRETVRLYVREQDVDVLLFDRFVREGDEAALGRAVDLHGAPLLSDWDESWLRPEREARRLAWHSAVERLAEGDLRRDQPGDAARRLTAAVAADPLRESAQRLLIEALCRAGDYAKADRQYQRFERLLRREVGLSPSPETRRALRKPIPLALIPEPQRPIERLVPVATTPVIGREATLRAALEALRQSRLVTLVGPGGVGKTRLSLACAEAIDRETFDQVAMVDLATVESEQSLDGLLARSVRAPILPGLGPMESALRHLEGCRALLLLDNCEHLILAAGELSQSVLSRCPQVSILATSRTAHGLSEETVLDVPPLNPEASESLFREGARRKGRPVPDSAVAAESTRRICAAVGGLPLGILLAAAALRTTTLRALSDDLYGALGERAGGRLRHRSLRSAIDWSYRLLSSEEADLLRCVSPIQGRWTAEIARAAVGSLDPPDDLLRGLVAKSLVEMREDEVGPWYRLLEPIREDAHRRLREAGEEALVRTRLRDWALHHSRSIYERTRGHPSRSERLNAEREIDTFETVLQDCLRTPEGRAVGVEIVVYGLTIFDLANRYREAAALQERFLAQGPDIELALRVLALAQIVHFRCNWGEAAAVIDLAQQAVDLARQAGDLYVRAYAISSQGIAWYYTDRLEGTLDAFEEAISIWEKIAYREGVYSASIWAGKAAMARGDFATAGRYFDRAERDLPSDGGHSQALIVLNRARIAYQEGRDEASLVLFDEAERTFACLCDRIHASSSRIGRAACLQRLGNRAEAADLLRSVEDEASSLVGDPAKLYEGFGPAGFRERLLVEICERGASE